MGKHRPTSTPTPRTVAEFLLPEVTDVFPVVLPDDPHGHRLVPWLAGLAVVGTVASGVVAAPQILSSEAAPQPVTSPLPLTPALTPAEVGDRLGAMAASRSARDADQTAAIEVQAAAETAAAEAAKAAQAVQETAEKEARAQEAAKASEAAQEPTLTPAAGVSSDVIARITNSAGPVSARVQAAANAVISNVPGAAGMTLGGTRGSAIDPDGHPSGNALDYMVGSNSALGDAIVAYHIANWDALGVDYIIWEQRYLDSPTGSWDLMEDRGGTTANHFDHPHVNYRP